MAGADPRRISDLRGRTQELVGIEEFTEGEEFTFLSKARHKRRLQDRWSCTTEGHTFCFTDTNSLHLRLTDNNMDIWVDMIHDGYATLLFPPEIILSSDTQPVHQTTPNNSIGYQRPFQFQLNPSRSDLSSWNSVSASSTSSGVPGPGYLSGKAIKWLGEKILDAITPLEIRRRMWVIQRLLKHLEKEPEETRWKWLVQRKKSVDRLVDDLLELSSDDYKLKYREASITSGFRFSKSLDASYYEDEGLYWLLSARISPLKFLSEEKGSTNSFSAKVREILVHEDTRTSGIYSTVPELVACVCNEITYGLLPESRRSAFELIHQLYFISPGRQELQRLGHPGGILENLAKKVFSGGIQHHQELACAVQFFVDYANDHAAFRLYVLGPNAFGFISRINANVQHSPIIDWDTVSWLSRCIGRISSSPWVIPALVDRDICNVFVRVLIAHHTSGHPDIRIDYVIVWTLRNVVVSGGAMQRAARGALAAETRDVLGDIREATWDIEWMSKNVRTWIADIVGDGTGGSVKVLKSRKAPTDLVFRI